MAGGDLANQRKRSAELRKRIVELKDQDWSFREIAAEVGRDFKTVWTHYQAAMREIPAAAVEEHQKKLAQRLDEQLRRIDMEREVLMDVVSKRHDVISNGHVIYQMKGRREDGTPIYGDAYEDDAPTMAAIDRLVKLDDQEAKLLGMYPKQQISLERPTSEVDAAVIGLIEQARRRAAEREAAAKGERAP